MATKAIPRNGSYARTAGDHQGVVCNQSFLFLGHPPMIGRTSLLVAAMPGSLVRGCLLLAANQYTCMHKQHTTHIHVEHIYICIHVRTYMQIYRPSSYPPPADTAHRSYQLPV